MLSRSKHCSAQLSLRAELIRVALMHGYLISLHTVVLLLIKVTCYSTSNIVNTVVVPMVSALEGLHGMYQLRKAS